MTRSDALEPLSLTVAAQPHRPASLTSLPERPPIVRAIGPFAVPDYGKGSYGAVLALHAIQSILSLTAPLTYSTALTMKFDDIIAEADFVAWVGAESIGGTPMGQPRLVIGEAKSFGRGDLIKSEDVAQLKRIGSKCPGAMLAVSVLREDFTDNEKRLLRGLVKWGRRLDDKGEHRNPVLLLTATETLDFFVTLEGTWKDKGGEHEKVADYNHTHGLYQIAEATVAIHLGLPTFEEERWRARERRVSSRKAQQAGRDNGEGAVP